MFTKKTYYTIIALVIGVVLVLNIVNYRLYLRLDFTQDHRYSLSDATKGILDELTSPVTVTAYFSENLPPDIERLRKELRDMLVEYSDYSDGYVVYDFVDPNADPQAEMKAQQAGIAPVMINVREKDQLKQQKAYLGVVLQYEDKTETIPLIRPDTPLEYELSSAIKKISAKNKPKVALLQGQGEPSLAEMQQLNELLSVTHEIQEITFTDTLGVPADVSTLAIIAPKDSIPDKYVKYLDEFVKNGGNVVVALNRVDGILTEARGVGLSTGFEKWLEKFGVTVNENFVIDQQCSNIMVTQRQGIFTINTPISFPYLPVVTDFAKESPITAGLESVMFPFVSSIDYSKTDSSVTVTPLLFSSEISGTQKPPIYFDVMKKWQKSDFKESHLPLGVALEGKLLGDKKTRMVVFGDGDFIVNGSGQQAQRLQEDNVNLMANAIDWLSDDTGLIALRTKVITSRPIDSSISESAKTILKYINFLLPIILLIIYGTIRLHTKKKIREKLAATDYEE